MLYLKALGVGDLIDLIGGIIRRLRNVSFPLDTLCGFFYPSVGIENVVLENIVVRDRL
jgi:hypothetical protein